MAVSGPEPGKKVVRRRLIVGIVVASVVAVAASLGGFYVAQSSLLGDANRSREAAQSLLANVLEKISVVSRTKAAEIANPTVSAALVAVSGELDKASVRTKQSLRAGYDYLCAGLAWGSDFARAGFGTNYTTMCAQFERVASLASGPIADFDSAFGDLTWSLVELDNAVSSLPPGSGGQKPVVTFSFVTKMNAVTWQFSVASAQPAVSPSNYRINFAIGTSVGTAVTLGPSGVNTTVMIPGATPSSVGVKWTDVGGSGSLKGGDVITIAFPSAPATGTSLTFYLLYSDGSQIQLQMWQG